MSNPEFFLARQPIVDRSRQLVAYELLFRAGNVGHAEVTSDIAATATVIRNAFMKLAYLKLWVNTKVLSMCRRICCSVI